MNHKQNSLIVTTVAILLFHSGCSQVGQYNSFSTDEEIRIGEQYSSQIEENISLNNNEELNRYINDLGQRMVLVSKRNSIQFTFKVVNDPAVNAFALPGGYCYVNTGLILFAENEAQLASVIGHEIGHVVAAHSVKRMSKSRLINQALFIGEVLGMIFIGQRTTENALAVADLASTGVLLKYSRNDELEADRLGIQQMHDAGIDPKGSQQFFKKIASKDARRNSGINQFLSTHPATEDRIDQAANLVKKLPVKKYKSISKERFNKIKEIVKKSER